jgi:hypothetical protein
MAVESRLPAYSAVDASATATAQLRSMIARADRANPESALADEVPLYPTGSGQRSRRMRTPAAETTVEATLDDEVRPDHAATAIKTSPLDFLFQPRPAPPTPSDRLDLGWRVDIQTVGNISEAEPRLETSEKSAAAPVSYVEPPPPAAAILKTGAVNGMAYTIYATGAIEAKLPQGTVRFSSIAELRAHIENTYLTDDR